MPKRFAAVDLGAESGRVVLGTLHGDQLLVDDVHRFPNEPVRCGHSLHWDLPRLWLEIQRGLAKAGDVDSVGADTWAVDFALLDEGGELLGNPFHYRDERNRDAMQAALNAVPPKRIYARTGIQLMQINSLYQLIAVRDRNPGMLSAAAKLLTIPDLLHYWMTGVASCEYTNATTTQLVDPRSRSWARDLIDEFALPPRIFLPLTEPGTHIGSYSAVAGCRPGTPVIAPATHDTASAVASIAARDGTAFLSSGTWSLLGMEMDHPVITDEALQMNFTNEGGVCGTTRLLKNVMGLWLLQCVKRSIAPDTDYATFASMAGEAPSFAHLFDPDDPSLLNPPDMCSALAALCKRTGQRPPDTAAAYVTAVLESLALKYRMVVRNLEKLAGAVHTIRVIGGGCKNRLLNQYTADATGKRVLAGPVEATALGNIAMQMVATGAVASLAVARQLIQNSFPTEVYEPQDSARWDAQAQRFEQCCGLAYV